MKVCIPSIPGFTGDAENLITLGKSIRRHDDPIPVGRMNFNPLADTKGRRVHRDGIVRRDAKPFTAAEMLEKKESVLKNTSN